LTEAARAIRRFLMRRPPELSQNGLYGIYAVHVALIAQGYPEGHAEVLKIWDQLRLDKPELAAAVEGRLLRTTDPTQLQCSDFGNAERLALRYGEDLRYCYPWRGWLVWDGQRWRQDDTGEVERRAQATVQGMYAEVADTPDRERRERLAKWALVSESDQHLKAMVRQAQSQPGIAIRPDELDRDPWRLNCLDGTLDLRTGELRRHRREDLLTKLVPVAYDANAPCPRWEQFLGEIFAHDQELITFIRRAVGYSLTGDTRERALFICYGLGRNGKSVFLETIAALLGDYAQRTPTRTLMAKHDGAIPNDVAMLKGMRFVHASESGEGKRLDEEFIKDATGEDTIAARFMRAEWFQFKPQFKLWLRTNHRPTIRGTDPAIWDRPRLIPFTRRFDDEEQDKELAAKLRAELPGILAWAVGGCLSWQMHGLGLPKAIKQATDAYREEMDVLGEWLADCCVISPHVTASSGDLYRSYGRWCEANAEKPLTRKPFASRLVERGFVAEKGTHGARFWRGVGLLQPAEESSEKRSAT
jgi:putative DNA primase/helicase